MLQSVHESGHGTEGGAHRAPRFERVIFPCARITPNVLLFDTAVPRGLKGRHETRLAKGERSCRTQGRRRPSSRDTCHLEHPHVFSSYNVGLVVREREESVHNVGPSFFCSSVNRGRKETLCLWGSGLQPRGPPGRTNDTANQRSPRSHKESPCIVFMMVEASLCGAAGRAVLGHGQPTAMGCTRWF